jgi:hypothetical protein
MDAGRESNAKMTPQRVVALEAVPGWTWLVHEAAWQETLAALRACVGAHGRLPAQSDASGLGDWVSSQRQAKKAIDAGQKCKHGTLTQERVAVLESVPGWACEVGTEALWQEKLNALRAYIAAHGRLPAQGDAAGLGV